MLRTLSLDEHGHGVLLVLAHDGFVMLFASDIPGSPARRPKRGAAWSPYRGAGKSMCNTFSAFWNFDLISSITSKKHIYIYSLK